jgi:hypothetical protein
MNDDVAEIQATLKNIGVTNAISTPINHKVRAMNNILLFYDFTTITMQLHKSQDLPCCKS